MYFIVIGDNEFFKKKPVGVGRSHLIQFNTI